MQGESAQSERILEPVTSQNKDANGEDGRKNHALNQTSAQITLLEQPTHVYAGKQTPKRDKPRNGLRIRGEEKCGKEGSCSQFQEIEIEQCRTPSVVGIVFSAPDMPDDRMETIE